MDILPSDLLLVIDVQNDFCPGGALAVADGDGVVPVINRLAQRFSHIVLTQDWHPAGHSSFATSHSGAAPIQTVAMAYGPQTLWPDHCVQGTAGAAFHPQLATERAELIVSGIAAQAAVGVAVAVLAPIVLWLLRRRRDALLSAAVMVGALGIAYVLKTLVAEHRPPRGLWVIPPDSAMSFPSGHATVAAAVALLLVMVVRGRLRWPAAVLGAAFAAVVAAARVYLGVHYPLDVLGGYLAAASAALLVAGVLDLPLVRQSLEDVGTPAVGRHHAGRTPDATTTRR